MISASGTLPHSRTCASGFGLSYFYAALGSVFPCEDCVPGDSDHVHFQALTSSRRVARGTGRGEGGGGH